MGSTETSLNLDDDILPEARIFEFRADNILKAKLEAFEEYINSDPVKEKVEENEEEDLLRKVKEKLKPKSRGRKPKSVPPVEESQDAPQPSRRSSRRRKLPEDVQVIPDAAAIPELSPSIKLPAAARRRIKDLQLNSSRQKRRINAENQRIVSACKAQDMIIEDDSLSDLASEQNIILKIRYLSNISKITVKEGETFSSIFKKVADMYKLKASEMLLCLEDRCIQHTDTPLSLNLKFFNVIDCISYKPTEDMEDKNDPNRILLRFQSNDSRKKIDMYTSKFEKFKEIMNKYAELRSIPLEGLIFEFDGEKIKDTETPEELDMESDSCIDVKVISENSKPTIPIIDITAEPIPESEMLDICVLD